MKWCSAPAKSIENYYQESGECPGMRQGLLPHLYPHVLASRLLASLVPLESTFACSARHWASGKQRLLNSCVQWDPALLPVPRTWHSSHACTVQGYMQRLAVPRHVQQDQVHVANPCTTDASLGDMTAGRAGRDGQRADCLLLYRFQDIMKLSALVRAQLQSSVVCVCSKHCPCNAVHCEWHQMGVPRQRPCHQGWCAMRFMSPICGRRL